MIKTLAIAALLAAPSAGSARCITRQQIADAAMTITPYAVDAVTEKCRPHLPADAFLAAKGQALASRLRAEGAGREASAAKAFVAFMGTEAPPIKDTESLVKVMGSMVSGLFAADLPVANCGEISGIMEALSPLPAQNVGLLAAAMTALISQGEKGEANKVNGAKVNSKFEICKGE